MSIYYGDLNDETVVIFDVEENGIDNDVICNFPVVGMNVDSQVFGKVTKMVLDLKLERLDSVEIVNQLKDSIYKDIILEYRNKIFTFSSPDKINTLGNRNMIYQSESNECDIEL